MENVLGSVLVLVLVHVILDALGIVVIRVVVHATLNQVQELCHVLDVQDIVLHHALMDAHHVWVSVLELAVPIALEHVQELALVHALIHVPDNAVQRATEDVKVRAIRDAPETQTHIVNPVPVHVWMDA